MVDWKELVLKENLSEEELRQIPCRCNITQQDNIKNYLHNNWDTECLLHKLPFSLDDLLNENLWLDPIDTLQFDINYHENLPYFEPHFGQYIDGLKFFNNESGIHRILIKLIPFKKILDLSNEISSKFNNEAKVEYLPINKNSGYAFYKPKPFKQNYSMGHECHFTRGVMESILKLKGFDKYSFKELFCSARFENILKYYYKDLDAKIVYREDSFVLNGKVIAERVRIDLKTLFPDTISQSEKWESVIRITEDIDYQGHKIFRDGEIFNAPYCCYHIEWNPLSLSKRIRQFFKHTQIRSAYKDLEKQLQIAQQKTHEVTQMKILLEQEIHKKDKFLTSTSHELRTPLNGIIGLIDSFISSNSENINHNNLDNLKTASISAWRLSHLINDILDYSKMGENSLILQKSRVSLIQVTDSVIKNLTPLVSGKPIIIETILPSNLPYIEADENRLQQILFNLIGNALKFTHKGKIVISAKVQKDELLIYIKDTGIGIPIDKLKSIFDTYDQGSEDVARRYGGTGLGLSVTKQLVELHGGQIWAKSEQVKGSKFFFTLPIATQIRNPSNNQYIIEKNKDQSILDTKIIPSEPVWKVSENGKSMILAIDDEPINLKVIQEYLSSDGYLVNSMISGVNLMKHLGKGVLPELIILDIFMPEISGYELCSEIRKKYPSHELPVLMLTASSNPEDMVQAFSLGANDYITKPVSQSELLARVKTHIKLKKSIERISISNKKLNIIDRLISFGFLASTFVLQNKISLEQENIILKKAYNYYKPLLDQFSIENPDTPESSSSKSERHDYFESVFNKLHNLESQKKLDLLYKIGEKVQGATDKEFSQEEIEEVSTNVFDLVSGLLLMEKPIESSLQPDPSVFGEKYHLTTKEIETVSLIYEGYSNQEIAGLLCIALNTVKQHVFHIFNKVGVENRTHLIYKLIEKN